MKSLQTQIAKQELLPKNNARRAAFGQWYPLFCLLLVLLLPAAVSAQISGRVFRDYNANGNFDSATENGVGGVTVTAYNASNAVIDQVTTASDGTYSLAVGAGVAARVEVTGFPAYLKPAPAGSGSGTVRFATGPASNVNVGLSNPAEVFLNPGTGAITLVTNCYVTGDNLTNTDDVLASFPDNAGAVPPGGASPAHGSVALANQVGPTWGLANQRSSNSLFASAFMKRHVSFGPSGTGAIYRKNLSTSVVSTFLDLNALFGSAGTDPHPTGSNFGLDAASFDAVGKISLGDLDISDDELTLYAINLADRQLYEMPLGTDPSNPVAPTAAQIKRWPFDTNGQDLTSLSGLLNNVADVRPFALKFKDGLVYVGLTGTAQSTVTVSGNTFSGGDATQLRGYVYSFDPATQVFTQVLSFPLNYNRGTLENFGANTTDADFHPWVSVWDTVDIPTGQETGYAQPWLSDIEFDRGDMIIGVRDRFGDQSGFNQSPPQGGALSTGDSGGDILRASDNGNGTWTLESNAAGSTFGPSAGAGTNQGPGGGEFYYQEKYFTNHTETSMGGLVQIPGFSQVLLTGYDPIENLANFFEGGVFWLHNTTGAKARGYRLYATGNGANGTFGKGNGLGDLEPLVAPADIEIGNFVWCDDDGDGIQDPNEAGISGVTVTLKDANGNTITTDLTDANGQYLFNSSNVTGGLSPNTSYILCVATNDAGLGGKPLTTQNYNANAGNSDLHDSDASVVGSNAQITLTTGVAGDNNHTYDFGFVGAAKLGNFVWEDANGDGIFQNGETPIQGATVNLCDANGNPVQDVNGNSTLQTNASGEYCFFVNTGTYIIKFPTPNGYVTCLQNQGADDNLDSDYDPANNNQTAPVTISTGQTNNSIDAAFKAPAKIGNFVWEDTNGDGIFQSGETPISGATVNLLDASSNPVQDVNGNSTLQTNAQGEYCFFVKPGTYIVQFPTPTNYVTCAKDQGANDQIDSDYDPANSNKTAPVTIASGQTNNSIDAAFKIPAKLGNFVWEDTNGDGIFQTGEPAISGATVNLLDASSNPVQDVNGNSTLQTNAQGEYCFYVKPGTYIVQFPTPTNYVTCAKDQGANDQIDSDYDPANGNKTAPVTIASGQTNNSIDAAFKIPAKLGNFVWDDNNGDGIFQTGEPAISGATVNLLDASSNPVQDVNGNSTLQTNANGEYCFYVKPGTYIVQFVTPTGYNTCAKDQGANDQIDSDYDPANGNKTAPVTIASGQTNNSIDAAFKAPAKIGNFVWDDNNGDGIFQNGEPAISGATVNLLDASSNPVQDVNGNSTLQTNANGEYCFYVKPGTYIVQFVTPTGYNTCAKDQGANDQIDSDYDPANGNKTAPVTIVSGQTNNSIDAAFKAPAKIGNFVWDDNNGDGIFQTGEPPISGATVNLLNASSNPVQDVNGNSTLQTNANGEYCFYVKPGTYIVQFVTPTGYNTCAKDQGANDQIDSDYDPANSNKTAPVTIVSGQTNNSIDAAFKAPAKLGNFVWEDTNGDGIFQTGEPAISGATVNLLNASGNPVQDVNGNSTLQTNAQGEYCFYVKPGVYIVQFPTPANYVTCAKDQGANDQIDSDYDPADNNKTAAVTIVSGQTNNSIDAAFKIPAKIGNFVWEDTNGDGIFQASEPPISGATVNLLDASGNPVQDVNGNSTLQTNANGEYCFYVKPGTYIVQFPTPANYVTCAKDQGANDQVDSDYDPANSNKTAPVTIASGQTNNSIDAAFKIPAKLGNFIWEDINGDGIFQSGEPPIQGATVNLLNASGIPVQDVNGNSTLQTNANGEYCFYVKPGTYILQFPTPANYVTCAQNQGANDELDSDYNPANSNKTAPVTIASGQTNNSIDAAFKVPAKLGNFVWDDTNGDGVFQTGEPPLQGATVNLLNASGNPVQDVNGNSTLQTNANGEYCFYVKPGTYILQFPTPNGYVTCAKDQGTNEELDSDYNPNNSNKTAPVTIASGQTINSIDAAFKLPSKLGNFVWDDINGDGIFQVGELPIQGATVNLLNASGNPVQDLNGNSTLQTNAQGEYCFYVKAGTYILQFPTPNGYTTCAKDQGFNDATDSDYDPNNSNKTAAVTIASGQTNNSIDAAFKVPAKLGNFVWEDTNGDGIFQTGEPPIPGATVNLLNASGNPVQDVNGNSTLQTNPQGEYCFYVKPGTYIVQFVTPTGFTTCAKDQGTNDQLDSDYDPANGNKTAPVTIASGQTNNSIDAAFKVPAKLGNLVWDDKNGDGIFQSSEPPIQGATVNLLNASGNPVQDENGNSTLVTNANGEYCFYVKPGTYIIQFVTPLGYNTCAKDQGGNDLIDSDYDPANGNKTAPVTIASGQTNNSIDAAFKAPSKLGNFVWEDANGDGIFQTGETPIQGATVNLLNASGNPVQDVNGNSTLQTNANGEYCFYVKPGTYILQFPTPTGYITCAKDQGGNDELDSDYNPTNSNKTAPVTIASGQTNNSIDAAFKLPAKLGNFVWDDKNGDGIFQTGELPIQGATVNLLNASGNPVQDLMGNSTLQTNAQGEYCFYVKAGTYILQFPTPNGYTTCAKDQGFNDAVDSDYNPNNGNKTAPVTIASGEINNSIDAAFKVPAKLGNFVWEDTNGDGIFQSGEPPLPGATVNLLNASGNPVQDLNGNSTLQTNAQGEYCFYVKPGVYIVQFPTPTGSTTCAKDQGTNDQLDSDYDPANNNKTAAITIASGQTNNSIDAAFKVPAKLGNFVWQDLNRNGIFEPGEPPIQGVTVKLLDANGNPAQDVMGNSTLQTNANGEYCFYVKPGTYILKFQTPADYKLGGKDRGNDDERDSDADPANNNKTAPVTVISGQTINSIDAGFYYCPATYMYCLSDEPQQQLTRTRLDGPNGERVTIKNKIIYGGPANVGGQPLAGFTVGQPLGRNTEAMAYDVNTQTAYIISNKLTAPASALFKLDLATGVAYSIGFTRTPAGLGVKPITALAFNNKSNELYGITTTGGSRLMEISTANAQVFFYPNLITADKSVLLEGASFDHSVTPPALYAIAEKSQGQIYTINLNTGLGTLVGKSPVHIESIEFTLDGTMYATAVSFKGRVYTIDRTTYAATMISSNPPLDCEGIAIVECVQPLPLTKDLSEGLTENEEAAVPTAFTLQQNYPNPFNPATVISFQLPVNSEVKVAIYSETGQLVRTLVDGEIAAGRHEVSWNGRSESGKVVAAGVYLYQITVQDQTGKTVFTETRRMTMLK